METLIVWINLSSLYCVPCMYSRCGLCATLRFFSCDVNVIKITVPSSFWDYLLKLQSERLSVKYTLINVNRAQIKARQELEWGHCERKAVLDQWNFNSGVGISGRTSPTSKAAQRRGKTSLLSDQCTLAYGFYQDQGHKPKRVWSHNKVVLLFYKWWWSYDLIRKETAIK